MTYSEHELEFTFAKKQLYFFKKFKSSSYYPNSLVQYLFTSHSDFLSHVGKKNQHPVLNGLRHSCLSVSCCKTAVTNNSRYQSGRTHLLITDYHWKQKIFVIHLYRTAWIIIISTAAVNYVLYTNYCHGHWTLSLGSFYSLLFIVPYSFNQSSFLLTIIIVTLFSVQIHNWLLLTFISYLLWDNRTQIG